jgi:hypothetical protein
MEKSAFTRACISCIKLVMAIMCILVVELLCQTVMGQLLVLKYLLSGAHGCLLSCLVVSSIKCHHFLRTRLMSIEVG